MRLFHLIAFFAISAHASIPTSPREERLTPFANRAAAREALERVAPGLAYSDPVPEIVTRVFERVDAGFRAVYPTLMESKAKPAVFVVPGHSLNEEFTRTLQEVPGQSYHGLLGVATGLLEGSGTEAALAGTIAHQLAHLYFHRSDGYQVLEGWLTELKMPLNSVQKGALERYVQNARMLGSGDAVLLGLPLGGGLLQTAFAAQLADLTLEKHACSNQVIEAHTRVYEILSKAYSYFTGLFEFTNEAEEKEARVRLTAFREKVLACANQVQSGPERFNIARIFSIGEALHEQMRNDYAQGLERVRWRSTEDEADETAVMILSQLELPTTDFVHRIVEEEDRYKPGLLERCEAAIRQHMTVPFGDLADPRHASCYRLQQVTQFSNRQRLLKE